jgi:hypothetical protein
MAEMVSFRLRVVVCASIFARLGQQSVEGIGEMMYTEARSTFASNYASVEADDCEVSGLLWVGYVRFWHLAFCSICSASDGSKLTAAN